MGDHWQMSKASWYATSSLGQLSLTITQWVSTVSTSKSLGIDTVCICGLAALAV